MTDTMTIRRLPVKPDARQAARIRARRRRVLRDTLLEALSTIGLGACFILCAILVMCVV